MHEAIDAASSKLSMTSLPLLSVHFEPPPTPLHLCSRMWHARFRGLSVSASHFFIIPHSIDSSASSNAPRDGPDLSHLGSDRRTDGRQEVQHQPIRTSFSRLCQGEGEKVNAADRGGRRRNGSLHFPFPPVEEIKHPPEELRSDARHWLLIISTWNWNQTGSLHNQSLQSVSAEISSILHPPTNSFIHPFIHPSTNSSIHPIPHPWQANTA